MKNKQLFLLLISIFSSSFRTRTIKYSWTVRKKRTIIMNKILLLFSLLNEIITLRKEKIKKRYEEFNAFIFFFYYFFWKNLESFFFQRRVSIIARTFTPGTGVNSIRRGAEKQRAVTWPGSLRNNCWRGSVIESIGIIAFTGRTAVSGT